MNDKSRSASYVAAGDGQKLWTAGDTYRVLASNDDTAGAFSVIEGSVPPGGGPPPHIHHKADEAFYLLDGELEITLVGDRTFMAHAGGFVFIPRGVPHAFKNTGTSPAKMLIMFTPAGLEKFFEAVGQPAGEGDAPPLSQAEIDRAIKFGPIHDLEILPPPDRSPLPAGAV